MIGQTIGLLTRTFQFTGVATGTLLDIIISSWYSNISSALK